MNLQFALYAVLIGMVISTQPAINQAGVRVLGVPVASAMLSISITLFLMTAMLLISGAKVDPVAFTRLPWWIVFGGVAGFVFVMGGVLVAPITGAALFFVCLVAGQVVGAALIDQFGAFGMTVRPVNLMRLAGMGLVLCGVLLVVIGSQGR